MGLVLGLQRGGNRGGSLGEKWSCFPPCPGELCARTIWGEERLLKVLTKERACNGGGAPILRGGLVCSATAGLCWSGWKHSHGLD